MLSARLSKKLAGIEKIINERKEWRAVCLQRGQHGSEGGVRMHLSGVTAPTLLLLKRGVPEDVYGAALQRLRARVRAGLPQSQSPGVECAHSSVAGLYTDAPESHSFSCAWGTPCSRADG